MVDRSPTSCCNDGLSAFAAAVQLLNQELSPREFIYELVRWLDLQMAAEPEGLGREMLVWAFVAAGPLVPSMATVDRTLEAAHSFVVEPTNTHYGALMEAATNSYPFGPGDGCYGVSNLGYAGCEPGSGCRSGAGCLVSLAEVIGYDRTTEAVRGALRSHLDDSDRTAIASPNERRPTS